MFTEPCGHVEQDTVDLGLLVVQQPHQVVVLLDGLQRLDEDGLPARRRSVGHALHAPTLFDLHRDHEAIPANRDQLVLHGPALREPAQVAAQRFLNRAFLLLDVAPDAP